MLTKYFLFMNECLQNGKRLECSYWEFPGGLVAKTLRSQCRGLRLDPWSGNKIPDATIDSSQATTKNFTCRNEGLAPVHEDLSCCT